MTRRADRKFGDGKQIGTVTVSEPEAFGCSSNG
jgi:hypothetical protein